jgi:hypothetical protein
MPDQERGALLSEAILVWYGHRRSGAPNCDDMRVFWRYGLASIELLPALRALRTEFYESDARLVTGDVAEMGRLASAEFRQRHPEISDAAIDALANLYAFDYK